MCQGFKAVTLRMALQREAATSCSRWASVHIMELGLLLSEWHSNMRQSLLASCSAVVCVKDLRHKAMALNCGSLGLGCVLHKAVAV